MAEQLQSFKKILTKKYIKTGTTPVFTGELKKLRGHWDAFVEYKCSELGLQKVQKAKDNASKKVYHHTLGQGGYKHLQYPNGRRWSRICLTEASNLRP